MKKTTLLLAFAFVGVAAFSQTKRIAHRSHSGSDNSFRVFADPSASFRTISDNFGNPSPREWKEEKKKEAPKKDTLKVMMPEKKEKKDTLKTTPVTKEIVVKEEVFAVLSAAKYIVTL